MRSAGYVLLRADLWADHRTPSQISVRLPEPDWRRYYSLRNQIAVLRRYGYTTTAARIALVRGLGKPVANLPRSPRRAVHALRQNVRAAWDGWRGHLGMTIDPTDWLERDEDLPRRDGVVTSVHCVLCSLESEDARVGEVRYDAVQLMRLQADAVAEAAARLDHAAFDRAVECSRRATARSWCRGRVPPATSGARSPRP